MIAHLKSAFFVVTALGVLAAACSSDPVVTPGVDAAADNTSPPNDSGPGPDGSLVDSPAPVDVIGDTSAKPFVLTSSAYTEGQTIPKIHECTSGGGQNQSMPLAWTPGPSGTMSYAIVMRDLDFQNGFIHWVIWDIPANVQSLPQGVQQVYQPAVPAGAKQAPFNSTVTGYFGPCSPSNVNTYELTLYAIPTASIASLSQASTKAQAATAIVGAAIASTKLSGES